MNQETSKEAPKPKKKNKTRPEPEKIVDNQEKRCKVEKVSLPIRSIGGCDGDCADPSLGGECVVELTPRKSRAIQVSIRVV